MQYHILFIEDDLAVSEMVKQYLERENYQVSLAGDGQEGLSLFQKGNFDLVLLDIMMPKLNGIEVLKAIRSGSMVPVLITSAKDSDVEKALGLELGADDYISKPFSLLELSARIKASLRRAGHSAVTESPSVIHCHELILDTANFWVSKNGQNLNLTAKEFEILQLFLKNPKRVFTKEQIYNLIWNDAYYGDENVINVHIRRLREKVEDNPSEPKYIKTIWGIGYKLGINE